MQLTLSKGADFVIRRLEERGFEAWAVGGCVRDSMLGRVPGDWDLTTNALPEETLACFSDCRVIETGLKHGTVTVLYENEPLEVTTYRVDGAYADNRHPDSVTFSRNLRDDLSRRDFTVNAMAYHPTRGLVDEFGGVEDLRRGLIRAVGDAETRFCEDGLRLLRAIRFASVLNFNLEEETAAAVHRCKALLSRIASERVRVELDKLICGAAAVPILREYIDVICEVLPELGLSVDFEQHSRFHVYDVWEHTLHALAETRSDRLMVRWGILLHDIGKPATYFRDEKGGHFPRHAEMSVWMANELLQRLKYDNATREQLLKLIRYHDVDIGCEKKQVKRAILRFGEQGVWDLLEIQRCDRLAHAPEHTELPPSHSVIPDLMREIAEEGACLTLRDLAVKGDDLLALGYRPGKELGEALARLLDAVIDGDLPNEKEALLESLKTE